MVTDKCIVAVVVLYHPNELVIKNISTYNLFVKNVVVVDNSEILNTQILNDLQQAFKIDLIVNNENIGIAAALNKGIEKAIFLGAEWILTMDQDSYFEGDMVKKYFNLFENFVDKNNTAVLGPCHTVEAGIDEMEKVQSLITSGSLLNAEVFKQLKGYEEKLFIDEVDNDYCYRAQLMGFNIYQCNSVFMNHSLGNAKAVKTFLGKTSLRSLHSPIRLYYIIRNACYMKMKYEIAFPNAIKKTQKDVFTRIKNNLLYGNDKLSTLKYILNGFLDFKRGRFGKYKNT